MKHASASLPQPGGRAWLLSLALLAAVVPVRAETVDTTRKEFTVQPGGRLEVDVDRGGIEVNAVAGEQVTIELVRKIRSGSKEEEENLLKQDDIQMTQDGNVVRIHGRGPSGAEGWFRKLTGRQSFDYQYTITVPTKFDVVLKTAGGGIDVTGLTGNVRANTSGGGLHFEKITGPIDGRTSGGGIKLLACAGEVEVHTSGGGIETRDGKGRFELDTSGGGITVRDHAGDVSAHTSGGGITAERVSGNLDADTSGGSIRASLLAQPTGECRLNTSGGSVTVELPENAAVNLDASTSAGSVKSEFPVTVSGEIKGDRLRGPINGGGPLLHVRSSAGSVRIVKGPPAGAAPAPQVER